MRPDGKTESLRQSMAWLHTWSGLLLGWLLYAVFFTGTLSFFRDEINDWMRPELHRPAGPGRARAVDARRSSMPTSMRAAARSCIPVPPREAISSTTSISGYTASPAAWDAGSSAWQRWSCWLRW